MNAQTHGLQLFFSFKLLYNAAVKHILELNLGDHFVQLRLHAFSQYPMAIYEQHSIGLFLVSVPHSHIL